MLKILILSLVIASTLFKEITEPREDELLKQFHEFISKYNKIYKSVDEFNARFQAFKDNIIILASYSVTRKSTHRIGV